MFILLNSVYPFIVYRERGSNIWLIFLLIPIIIGGLYVIMYGIGKLINKLLHWNFHQAGNIILWLVWICGGISVAFLYTVTTLELFSPEIAELIYTNFGKLILIITTTGLFGSMAMGVCRGTKAKTP